MRFLVRYHRPGELASDFDREFSKGGLLVRAEPPAPLHRLQEVELEIVCLGRNAVLAAQVIQQLPGKGVALSVDATSSELSDLVEEARDSDVGGERADHEFVAAPDATPSGPASGPANSTAAKIHMALHGKKEERMKIMRDGDRSLHRFVLRNPGLRMDEITFIAKMTTVAADTLKAIAERREWFQRPEIALALVRNPKTPMPLALQMLQHLAPQDLRRLAKGSSARMPILQAARKRVVS